VSFWEKNKNKSWNASWVEIKVEEIGIRKKIGA